MAKQWFVYVQEDGVDRMPRPATDEERRLFMAGQGVTLSFPITPAIKAMLDAATPKE